MGRNSIWSPTRIYNKSIIFNTFLCDLFLFIKNKEVARYADYTTPYETGADSAYVIHNSEVWKTHFWTGLTATVRKVILINIIFFLPGNDSSRITIGNETTSSSECEKRLWIKIDSNLNFKEHIESLFKKASQKINALSRLSSSMNFE